MFSLSPRLASFKRQTGVNTFVQCQFCDRDAGFVGGCNEPLFELRKKVEAAFSPANDNIFLNI